MASRLLAEWNVVRTQPPGVRRMFFNDLSDKQKAKLAADLAALGEEMPPELDELSNTLSGTSHIEKRDSALKEMKLKARLFFLFLALSLVCVFVFPWTVPFLILDGVLFCVGIKFNIDSSRAEKIARKEDLRSSGYSDAEIALMEKKAQEEATERMRAEKRENAEVNRLEEARMEQKVVDNISRCPACGHPVPKGKWGMPVKVCGHCRTPLELGLFGYKVRK